MQTIVKLEARQEMTSSGTFRTVYKRTVFYPGHPDYDKEKAARDAYVKEKFIQHKDKPC